jgi:hypothetical protein
MRRTHGDLGSGVAAQMACTGHHGVLLGAHRLRRLLSHIWASGDRLRHLRSLTICERPNVKRTGRQPNKAPGCQTTLATVAGPIFLTGSTASTRTFPAPSCWTGRPFADILPLRGRRLGLEQRIEQRLEIERQAVDVEGRAADRAVDDAALVGTVLHLSGLGILARRWPHPWSPFPPWGSASGRAGPRIWPS